MASSSQDPFDSFDAAVDDAFDDLFEQAFENISIHVDQEEQKKKRKKRAYIERHREEGHIRLWNDYFSETPTYPDNIF